MHKVQAGGRAALLLCAVLALCGCTFSDALRHDDVRSVWAPAGSPVAHPPVFFATDRQADASPLGYGQHWDAAAHCGMSRLSIPAAITPGAAPGQAQAEAPQPLDCGGKNQMDGMARAIAEAAGARHCNSVLLIVHGYNTTFRTGLLRAGQIATDTQWPCVTVLFSWSSEGLFARYVADTERSGYSVPLLIAMLRAMDAAGLRVNVIAQSMGARVAMSAVAALCGERRAPIAGELILAAPDVSAEQGNDDFGHLLRYAMPCLRRTTIYASGNDMALIASENIHGGVPRAGRVPEMDMQYATRGPGGIVDVVDTSQAPGDPLGHGYFVLSHESLNDMMGVLAGTAIERRAAAGSPGGPTLICADAAQPRCADGRGRYVLAVAPERQPDWSARLVRHLWPLVLPVQ